MLNFLRPAQLRKFYRWDDSLKLTQTSNFTQFFPAYCGNRNAKLVNDSRSKERTNRITTPRSLSLFESSPENKNKTSKTCVRLLTVVVGTGVGCCQAYYTNTHTLLAVGLTFCAARPAAPVLVASHEIVRAERLQVSENLACKNMHHRLFRLHAACGHRETEGMLWRSTQTCHVCVCSGKEVCSSGLQEKGINFKFEEKFFFCWSLQCGSVECGRWGLCSLFALFNAN